MERACLSPGVAQWFFRFVIDLLIHRHTAMAQTAIEWSGIFWSGDQLSLIRFCYCTVHQPKVGPTKRTVNHSAAMAPMPIQAPRVVH